MAGGLVPLTFPEQEDGPVILEYIMVECDNIDIITKTYVIEHEPLTVEDCPVKSMHQFDTPQRTHPCPELAMRPVTMCRDPFRQGRHKIVLCVPEYSDDRPNKTVVYNTREKCSQFLDQIRDQEPWYGFEQEYYIADDKGNPLDYGIYTDELDLNDELSTGTYIDMERTFADMHLRACIYAGLKMYGMNREASPSQWEYQIGPLPGVQAADQVVMARYILLRLAEMNKVKVTFKNPPDIRHAGSRNTLHLNFSTKDTRAVGGLAVINTMVENMRRQDQSKVLRYYDIEGGQNMQWFLSGEVYMPRHDEFVYKVSDKDGSSVRIPAAVAMAGCGYIEDRRPMADADPYEVTRVFTTSALFDARDL